MHEVSSTSINLTLVVMATLAGCAHTAPAPVMRIDGASPETFQASWDRLYRSLELSERFQLEAAILPIALGHYHSVVDVPPSVLAAGFGPQDIRAQIDGLSYREIIALAQRQPVKVSVSTHP